MTTPIARLTTSELTEIAAVADQDGIHARLLRDLYEARRELLLAKAEAAGQIGALLTAQSGLAVLSEAFDAELKRHEFVQHAEPQAALEGRCDVRSRSGECRFSADDPYHQTARYVIAHAEAGEQA